MPVPLAIPILGGAAALATILYVALKSDGSGGFPKAEAEDLAQRVCDKGPRGELVFKPELAASLVTSLASQTYQYELATDRSLVQIAPSPGGRPLILSESALGWAKSLNDTHSILAPLYLAAATPAGTKRFLRAVPAGQESDYAGPSAQTMYAVLAYAGTFRANLAPPGKPPGGGSVSPTPNAPTTPSGLKSLPAEVQRALDDLLANGRDPDAMEAVAAKLDSLGFPAEATKLRARAAELRAQRPLPPVVPPVPPPSPSIPPPAPSVPVSPAVYPGGGGLPLGPAKVIAPTGVYIRSSPSTSALILVGATVGSTVNVLEYQPGPRKEAGSPGPAGWARVSYGGTTGYCTSEWLQPLSGGGVTPSLPVSPAVYPGPSTPAAALMATVRAPQGLNVRASASAGASKLGAIPAGWDVTVLGYQPGPKIDASGPYPGGWANVRWEQPGGAPLTGWVISEWLEPKAGALAPSSPGVSPALLPGDLPLPTFTL